ncbi:MAG: (Fe-S)-binding protein [Solirubrobacteraceae bacterium]
MALPPEPTLAVSDHHPAGGAKGTPRPGPVGDAHQPALADLIGDCVHCGFCLPTCPTYVLWGEEMDSPRGRIVLMGEGLEEEGEGLSPELVGHLDNCLGCMACVTSCPSGVKYDQLITRARPQVERRFRRPGYERLFRRVIFATFPRPGRLRAMAPFATLAGRLGLDRAAQRLPLPAGLRAMIALAPEVPFRAAFRRLPEVTPARGEPRGRVALLQGCIQRVFFGDVNEATLAVLSAEGYEVHAPRAPRCCGSLMMHSGFEDEARVLAKQTIAALEGHKWVVVNAAGCGSGMKEYRHLLDDEPEWAQRAADFSEKVIDVHELLAAEEPRAARRPLEMKVVYHDACHLAHAQGVRAQPRELLRSIPGLELLEPDEAEICCGSAGIYNLLKPEAAGELGRRKEGHLRATGAEAIAAANPGCSLQIAASSPDGEAPLPVFHPMELLAMSIEGSPGDGNGRG